MIRSSQQFPFSHAAGLAAACFVFSASLVYGQTSYLHRSFYDNSQTSDREFYSAGVASTPSTLELREGKLPVETDEYFSAPNALRLNWQSKATGGWVAEIRLYEWRNRNVHFAGDTLQLWCFTRQPLRSEDLPGIALKDSEGDFTSPLTLGAFASRLSAGRWFEIEVPLSRFQTASMRPFNPHHITTVIFTQGPADNTAHTLLIDEVRIDFSRTKLSPRLLRAPHDVQAKGYERHVEVSWSADEDPETDHVAIYRSVASGPYKEVGIILPGLHRFIDFIGRPGVQASYKVRTINRRLAGSAFSEKVSAATRTMNNEELLTMFEEGSFRYCWENVHPASGMLRENLLQSGDIVATGATGFGIMAFLTGVERGFITRQQAVERLLKITSFLQRADRFHGVWPHFTDGATGKRQPVFGMFDNGADLVETSFLAQGLLAARHYFDGKSSEEQELRTRINRFWKTIEWDWFRRAPDSDALYWHWSPEYSWYIDHRLTGWNEIMITYLLAIASPTHGVPPSLYYTGWAGQSDAAVHYRQSWGQVTNGDHYVNGHTYEGIKLFVGVGDGGPLFFTHYSFLGLNPHGLRDRFADYFENNRNMARINYAYCLRNPGHFKGYGHAAWGITAVDGPNGYVPYEPDLKVDDGTIAPTGAATSYPYLPKESMDAMLYYYRVLGDRLWSFYGFRDAFNLQQNWFSRITMGINQAPTAVMIENGRTGLIWKHFMANPEVQSALQRIGFQ